MSDERQLTHIDEAGRARMVDVGDKKITQRVAIAVGTVRMERSTLSLIESGNSKKGDVLAAARIAGIQAAKKCSDLIPLCHPLALNSVEVHFDADADAGEISITSACKVSGKTGVEMEALTAVSVAALTIYDMLKAVDRAMEITDIRLMEKSGGKSGDWTRRG